MWDATGGEYEERSKVCLDCTMCKGKPPLLDSSNSPEDVKLRIVSRIESLISQENAGHLDNDLLDFFEFRLIEIWRQKELEFERLHKQKIAQIFEAMRQNRHD